MDLCIKVGRVPGRLTEVVVAEGTSVREALRIAGLSANANEVVSINGERAELSDELEEGDRNVTLSSVVKGN